MVQKYIFTYIKKELIRYIMEVSGTPVDGGILTQQFQGKMITFNEPSPGKINACFDDISLKLRYEAKDYELKKINYKTVIASIKNTHPQIISAKLLKTEDDSYSLTVSVRYQFLPEIKEEIGFEKREIPAEEEEQAVVRGMRTYVKGIRDQLNSLGSVQITRGQLDQTAQTEVFIKLNHKTSVFTWGLNFTKMSGNMVKPQMYYYNSITKQRKSSGAVPEEGVYVHHGGQAYIEIKFLAELQDFDMVIFSLSHKSTGEYTIACEKVQKS